MGVGRAGESFATGGRRMSQTPQRDDRGQTGVATLVVFAALILVAAISAGALIATANALDVAAVATGTESVSQLSDRVEVLGATGQSTELTVVTTLTIEIADGESVDSDGESRTLTIDDVDLAGTNLTRSTTSVDGGLAIDTDEINATASNVTAVDGDRINATVLETSTETTRTVDSIRLTTKKAPGSDPVDATDATVEYTSDRTHSTLTADDDPTGDSFAPASIVGASAVLEENGDRVRLEIDAAAVRGDLVLVDDGGTLSATDEAVGLEAGETVTLHVVTAGGGTTEYALTVPDMLHSRTVSL